MPIKQEKNAASVWVFYPVFTFLTRVTLLKFASSNGRSIDPVTEEEDDLDGDRMIVVN